MQPLDTGVVWTGPSPGAQAMPERDRWPDGHVLQVQDLVPMHSGVRRLQREAREHSLQHRDAQGGRARASKASPSDKATASRAVSGSRPEHCQHFGLGWASS